MFVVNLKDKRGYTAGIYHFFGDYSELSRLYGVQAHNTIIETLKASGDYADGDKIEVIEHLEINTVFVNYERNVAQIVWLFKMHGVGVFE